MIKAFYVQIRFRLSEIYYEKLVGILIARKKNIYLNQICNINYSIS